MSTVHKMDEMKSACTDKPRDASILDSYRCAPFAPQTTLLGLNLPVGLHKCAEEGKFLLEAPLVRSSPSLSEMLF